MASPPLPHTRAYLSAILSPGNATPAKNGILQLQSSDSNDSELTSPSDGHKEGESLVQDDKTQRIIDILEDDSMDEDNKPEALKEKLALYVSQDFPSGADLDSLVLSLLHRHREDLHPTGQTFALPSTQAKTPTAAISRSGSFRRTFSQNLTLSRKASGPSLGLNGASGTSSGPPSRPHSPSPLRVQAQANLSNDIFDNDASLLSPRHLNVTASEFRPRVSSGNAANGANVWAMAGSPLGTPKYGSTANESPASSYSANAAGSYFPQSLTPSKGIPHDPWSSNNSVPGMTTSSASDDGELSIEDKSDPFAPKTGLQPLRQSHSSLASSIEDHSPISGDLRDDESFPGDFASDDFSGSVWDNDQNNPPDSGNASFEQSNAPAYSMTPLDVLLSVFAETGLSTADLEDALGKNGWEVDRTMDYLVAHSMNRKPPVLPGANPDHLRLSMPLPEHAFDDLPGQSPGSERFPRASSPMFGPPHLQRPGMMSRSSSYDSRRGMSSSWQRPQTPTGGMQSPGGPLTPTGNGPSYPASAASNRVCRYYLQGSCLRSDCRYNHNISKAVCRFWLRGHCLKGPDRCDFMHMIPPHLSQDVAILRMRLQASDRRDNEQDMNSQRFGEEEEFPSLGTSGNRPRRDPAVARWSAAVKSGRPIPPERADVRRPFPTNQDRISNRIPLKPPMLLPTLKTGSSLSDSYANHRARFLELGAARARSLTKAAESWKRGDGAGARYWSKEAQAQDLERLQAGRDAAVLIAAERKKQLRDAVMKYEGRDGRADAVADRSSRGQEVGGGLGICLGISARSIGSAASPEERAEAALDLHGLHAEEATDMIAKFLMSLERENFLGTAYLITGQEKHTLHSQVRTRLGDSVGLFLDQYKYPYRNYSGTFAIDALIHS